MAPPIALITSGSADVLINGVPAATITSKIAIHKKGDVTHHSDGSKTYSPIVVQGSSTTLINGLPAARIADSVSCGGVICKGSSNVFIDGVPAARIADKVVC